MYIKEPQNRSNSSQYTNGSPDPGFGLASAVLASSHESPRSPQASLCRKAPGVKSSLLSLPEQFLWNMLWTGKENANLAQILKSNQCLKQTDARTLKICRHSVLRTSCWTDRLCCIQGNSGNPELEGLPHQTCYFWDCRQTHCLHTHTCKKSSNRLFWYLLSGIMRQAL